MFTGIIQSVGQIKSIIPIGDDLRLFIDAGSLNLTDVHIGDSIATNGVCLTVVTKQKSGFEVHVSRETLNCTVGLEDELPVNLEKALCLSDRLGGHIVTGHVDGIGQVTHFETLGDCSLLSIRAPHELAGFIAAKGSIAVNGVSLTVNRIEKDTFSVNLIPHTLENTTLNTLGIGSRVNLEIDIIARYVNRMSSWKNESL
jgi:riboflavin synthase